MPSSDTASLGEAKSRLEAGDVAEAEAALTRIIEDDPGQIAAKVLLAHARKRLAAGLALQDRWPEVAALLRSSIEFDAHNPILHVFMAGALERLGEPGAAGDYARRARDISRFSFGLRPFDLATDMEEAAQLSPELRECYAGIHIDIAENLIGAGRHQEAAGYLGKIAPLGVGLPRLHCILGGLFLESGEIRKAAVLFEQCLSEEPDTVDARRGLSECLERLGKREEARPHQAHAARLALHLETPELDMGLKREWLDFAENFRKRNALPAGGAPGDGTLIFHHVRNTAGSTLRTALLGLIPSSQVYLGYGQSLAEYKEALAKFRNLSDQDKANIRLIVNHGYDLYHLGLPRKHAYATMLRHPVAHVKSRYFHWYQDFRQDRPGRENAWFESQRDDFTFRMFVDTLKERQADNTFARWMAVLNFDDEDGVARYRALPDGESELHALAVKALDAMPFVCIMERISESCLMLALLMGFDRVPFWSRAYPEDAEIVQVAMTEDLDPAVIRDIEKLNAADMALYEEYTRRFEEKYGDFLKFFKENIGSLDANKRGRFLEMAKA